MEITGNFLIQPNKDFPLDCETLDAMQTNTALTAVIGNLAGDKLILTGCELTNNGNAREAGYVFVRTKAYPQGEVMRWEGGDINGGMYVKLEDVAVDAQGYKYPKAYTRRTLAPGIGSERFDWADFRKPATPEELEKQVAALTKLVEEYKVKTAVEPLGIVKMWAGKTVPEGYALCDGRALLSTEYTELYAILGTTFNRTKDSNGKVYSTLSGYFRLPDLRGRFIVGYNEVDNEYKIYGNAGGEKKHTLTVDEMPAHAHNYTVYAVGRHDRGRYSGKDNRDSDTDENRTTTSAGGGASHENRPPYYVLAYIMKIK